uniref:Uncharacterized protein n=1 Tax=Gouania willdenowi TaxID=441366 RepID=A0A8C5EPZ6_GOUWI
VVHHTISYRYEGLDQNDGQTEAELLETQYPHVKKSLQQGEALYSCLSVQDVLHVVSL